MHSPPDEGGLPSRAAATAGAVVKNGELGPLRAMILISPRAKAIHLIEAVRDSGAAIAVSTGGKIRPLHLSFAAHDSAMVTSPSTWLEARVSANGITVEAVPDKVIVLTALDQLAAALEKARVARGYDQRSPVDVLVDPDVDVQRFIDVVVALDTAGVTVIGMGGAPSADELARRGHRTATVHLGVPNRQGDLDRREIRDVVKAAQPALARCYETALVASPSLGGVVQAQFFITAAGTVTTVAASGVSAAVSSCIGAVIKTLAFPKPKDGGGVQVNFPFSLRN